MPGTKHTGHLLHVVGARPNVMKLAPLYLALKAAGIEQRVLHTGQHYDPALASELFEDFGLPKADANLGLGKLAPAQQFGEIVSGVAREIEHHYPAAIMVYGDVRSTPAAAIAAYYSGVPCVHYEAGARAFTRSLPEEMNRIATDAFCDVALATEPSCVENLRNMKLDGLRIELVGNLMCDAARLITECRQHNSKPAAEAYMLATCHRQETVDNPGMLAKVVGILADASRYMPIVFVVHPRTHANLSASGLLSTLTGNGRVEVRPALRYSAFITLLSGAKAIISDSGGIVAEAAYLGVPHVYLRERCEHILAVEAKAVTLAGLDRDRVAKAVEQALSGRAVFSCPQSWDGYAAQRIVPVVGEVMKSGARR